MHSAYAGITMPDGHKVIFRYRCFSGSIPEWVSPLTAAGNISHASGSDDIATLSRGTGFSSMISTDFDGSSEFVQGSASLNTTDSAGGDSFAVEAWFKPDSVTGSRSLMSNTENNQGFALKIIDGRLRGYVRFRNGTASVSESISMDAAIPNIETGKWHYAVFHVRRAASNYEIRLYLNGTRVAYKTTSSLWNGVWQCAELPIVGAEPTAGTGDRDFFDGQIYAVAVSNWDIYLDNYVKNTVVRDASRYLGVPSYHDYLNTEAGIPYRIHRTVSDFPDLAERVTARLQLPYLNDDYVPQGTAYDDVNDLIYVAYYYCDTDGVTDEYPSFVAEFTRTGNLRRTIQLLKPDGSKMTGHCGGLGYHNSNLYATYGDSIYRYRLSDLPNPTYVFDPMTFANPRADQNAIRRHASYKPSNPGNTTFSNIEISTDYNGDTLLWTSEFSDSAYMKLFAYRITAEGAIETTPLFSCTLPVTNVQGVACYWATATEFRFFLCCTGVGKIYTCRYLRSGSQALDLADFLSMPAGCQDLELNSWGELWTNSESGAKYYQKQSANPWNTLYPFAIGIDVRDLVPSVSAIGWMLH